ncbi:MarR family winged helix-turn-helix transcriptional regulator [Rhizobium sp. RCC_161_2]|uniref:MarR family winged helix-turn-helix transcriptional regulator n=1 Tax=Rhizobium sp. RCC_161_2 TaxID=3239219 RepID=UPI0035253D30
MGSSPDEIQRLQIDDRVRRLRFSFAKLPVQEALDRYRNSLKRAGQSNIIRYAYYVQIDPREEAPPIRKAVPALGRRLWAERPEGTVTLAALSILGTLSRLGPIPATRLAAEERLQPQSLTRLVGNLERVGLVERQRNIVDRRALRIGLTEKGRTALIEDLNARQRWLEKAMATVLTDEERAGLTTAAQSMLKLAFHAKDLAE